MKVKTKMRASSIYVLIIFLTGLLIGAAIEQDDVKLFANGTIYINSGKKVENLLVVDGVVKAIDANPNQIQGAKVIDLEGAAAYPGFIDSHVHLLEAGYGLTVGSACNNA